jgi:hypothetical protein
MACPFDSNHLFICVYSVIKYITFSQQFSKLKKIKEHASFLQQQIKLSNYVVFGFEILGRRFE